MNNKAIILLFFLTAGQLVSAQKTDNVPFVNPVDYFPILSASFAELRNDHFHSGIDYKTGGVAGREVYAAAEGYVYRIGVSPTGYGKALYIRHPDGYSTVYGHLARFRPDIEEFVNKRQYELKRFNVSLYPSRDQFRVGRSEIIAWSGNSGSSSGPHLHFEVRESSSEEPVNPLLFGMGINDNTNPVAEKIFLYPLTGSSSVNNSHERAVFAARGSGGNYSIESDRPVTVNGSIGIGIKCWDRFDESNNKCGVFSIEMDVDSAMVYSFTAKKFSFSESRYLNSHIDYAANVYDKEFIHRLFLQPGNKLSMYRNVVDRGVITFSDDGDHDISIRISDQAGNVSIVNFRVRSVSRTTVEPKKAVCDKVLPYGKASDFTADGIRIHFPALALYDTLFFEYDFRDGRGKYLSPIHSVHNAGSAVHDPFRLSLRPDSVPQGAADRLCLARIDSNGKRLYAGGEYRYGFVSADLRQFGDYAITMDTVRPVIKPSFTRGADLGDRDAITFTATDDFSGISSYDATIDGAWALLEWDPKYNLLIYRPLPGRIKKGLKHKMEVRVSDDLQNTTVISTEFYW